MFASILSCLFKLDQISNENEGNCIFGSELAMMRIHLFFLCRSMINQQLQASMLPRVGDVLIIISTRHCLIRRRRRRRGSNILLLICLKFDHRRRHEKSDVDVIDKKNCVLNN